MTTTPTPAPADDFDREYVRCWHLSNRGDWKQLQAPWPRSAGPVNWIPRNARVVLADPTPNAAPDAPIVKVWQLRDGRFVGTVRAGQAFVHAVVLEGLPCVPRFVSWAAPLVKGVKGIPTA